MHDGRAFSWFSFGSLFLYARYWRAKMKASCPSLSLVGFDRPSPRKVATTLLMVLRIVEEAMVLEGPREYLPERRAVLKAPMMSACCCLENRVR